MDARDLLIENLDLVERVIAFTSRRQHLADAEAEDFASTVKLKLIENDYAIVRKFEGRSSFSTYLMVVVQRIALDYRIHQWGKWHPSAEAKRLGETAVELERILNRDGRPIEDALFLLQPLDPAVTLESLRALAAKLPPRPPRRRLVELDEAAAVPAAPAQPSTDRTRNSHRVSGIVRKFIETLPPEEKLILQLRFESEMTVAQIARSLHLDQKQLYRRLERHLRQLRDELEGNGIDAAEANDLIGDRGVVLDFRLGNGAARPSKSNEETATPGQEEVSR